MNDTGNAQDPASTLSDSPPLSPPHEERTLRRGEEGRMLTGVCAGLGRYAGVDPVLFRVGFAVLVLGSGIGVMLYVAAFLLMRETNGGPGYMEQWTRRDFDAETVMALLTGVFAFGLIINLSSDGISTGTVIVGTLFAITLLTAHSRGVDLLAVARSLPDRLRGRRVPRSPEQPSAPSVPFAPPASSAPPAAFTPSASPAAFTPSAPFASPPDVVSSAPAPAPVSAPAESGESGESGEPPAAEPDTPARAQPYQESRPYREEARERLAPPEPGPGPRERTETFDAAHAAPPPAPPATPAGAPPAGNAPRTAGAPSGPYHPAGISFDSSGEPFSPYGPYRPLDPRRRQQPYSPYDLSGYGQPVERAPRPKRPRSFVGGITIFLAMIVGGIIVATQSTSGSVNLTVVGGAMLVTIGAGLLVATWFGRGAALVAAGAVIAIALVAGSTLVDMPKKFGSYHWEPTKVSEIARTYSVGVGEGTLDLSELPLPPGSRTVLDVSVSVGQISVILPATARAEVNGYTKFGDVKIDHSVEGGADVRYHRVLEPERPPKGDVATVVLNVKAGIGDVEVRRGA
ncbi:PspC domain-containing protein [Streptosporangium carneum]|uniref:Phage shock protein PspC N-terminal domain-containing protein n=1 Tax=Streptosporangium carneum TaxID=47481 RepID=A0A9W6I6P3_9ACTN|nr:PspC domain-containing protein [Streptosporangium carneum]GLK11944.1 hypothetical protein GCM10017600_53520 [Streptosporangium carneum]